MDEAQTAQLKDRLRLRYKIKHLRGSDAAEMQAKALLGLAGPWVQCQAANSRTKLKSRLRLKIGAGERLTELVH